MKKYVDEKYADLILQLAHKYHNENPGCEGSRVWCDMDKTLETMDKYGAKINRMGYMMHTESIDSMLGYISALVAQDCEFSADELQRVYNHLEKL